VASPDLRTSPAAKEKSRIRSAAKQSINITHNNYYDHITVRYILTMSGLGTRNFYFQDRKKLKFQDIFQDIRPTYSH